MNGEDYPVVLSFDVGVIHLSYCLLTQKKFLKPDGTTYVDWCILDWNNIDLTNRDEKKCACGAKASLTQTVNGDCKYYCKTHGKKVDTEIEPFESCFISCGKSSGKTCMYHPIGGGKTPCGKSGSYVNKDLCYCTTHAKQKYKSEIKQIELKPFKLKSSTTLNFDDVKYSLMMELEKRTGLLAADYVVIENQPSFKNPRMKSIASTLYDYYLIRGIIDRPITKSKISQVKFMSPSNKLKLASEGDTKQLVKAKSTDDTKAYKLTKSLGIKYCLDLIVHLPDWIKHFNSFKKRDDLADSFLQGAYFYSNVLHPVTIKQNKNPIENKKESENKNSIPTHEENTSLNVQTTKKSRVSKLLESGVIKKTKQKKQVDNEIEV